MHHLSSMSLENDKLFWSYKSGQWWRGHLLSNASRTSEVMTHVVAKLPKKPLKLLTKLLFLTLKRLLQSTISICALSLPICNLHSQLTRLVNAVKLRASSTLSIHAHAQPFRHKLSTLSVCAQFTRSVHALSLSAHLSLYALNLCDQFTVCALG